YEEVLGESRSASGGRSIQILRRRLALTIPIPLTTARARAISHTILACAPHWNLRGGRRCLLELAREADLACRKDGGHGSSTLQGCKHLHIGPINHILIKEDE